MVFAIEIDGDAVAVPKNMMEVHEMINMTIGGRRVGVPYCTLCGSAQAYLTDDTPNEITLDGAETFELRTSGLLSRSNKVMFEFHTSWCSTRSQELPSAVRFKTPAWDWNR